MRPLMKNCARSGLLTSVLYLSLPIWLSSNRHGPHRLEPCKRLYSGKSVALYAAPT